MFKKIEQYIKDGFTIRPIQDGFEVFTIPTQWFKIHSLTELNAKKFELEVKRQEIHLDIEQELIKLSIPPQKEYDDRVVKGLLELSKIENKNEV